MSKSSFHGSVSSLQQQSPPKAPGRSGKADWVQMGGITQWFSCELHAWSACGNEVRCALRAEHRCLFCCWLSARAVLAHHLVPLLYSDSYCMCLWALTMRSPLLKYVGHALPQLRNTNRSDSFVGLIMFIDSDPCCVCFFGFISLFVLLGLYFLFHFEAFISLCKSLPVVVCLPAFCIALIGFTCACLLVYLSCVFPWAHGQFVSLVSQRSQCFLYTRAAWLLKHTWHAYLNQNETSIYT